MKKTKRKKNIKLRVKKLIKKYNTTDLFKLCSCLKIEILYCDLGNLKGYFKNILGNRMIILNENLDEISLKIVLAHELGHAYLHNTQETRFMHNLHFAYTISQEREANEFMFEILKYKNEEIPYEVIKKCGNGIELFEKLNRQRY